VWGLRSLLCLLPLCLVVPVQVLVPAPVPESVLVVQTLLLGLRSMQLALIQTAQLAVPLVLMQGRSQHWRRLLRVLGCSRGAPSAPPAQPRVLRWWVLRWQAVLL